METQEALWKTLIAFLRKQHDVIMSEERAAYQALDAGDHGGYRTHMVRKAELLSELFDDLEPYTEGLEAPLAEAVGRTFRRFSKSAAHGLALDSLFYMSALLYREEHPRGEPDNLLVAIREMEAQGLDYRK